MKLRFSSYIDPSTGAKLDRTFTLHTYDVEDVNYDNEDEPQAEHALDTTPLLSFQGRDYPVTLPPKSTRLVGWTRDCAIKTRKFILSDVGKSIFKCAVAYVLGSLATFVPQISRLLGKQDSKHMVATITVYFHPARSLGSMLDALLVASTAFLYTALVSLLSMTVSAFFADTVHLIKIGHAIVLVVFVGGGLGLVGWIKLKRNDALVNIGCSLASLALITILTKEGAVQAGDYSVEKISQILKMIATGVTATMLVSFLIFPISARFRLRKNLLGATDALSDMLALITSSFLSGDESELEDNVLAGVSDRHKKLSASIDQSLKESRYEHYLFGTERQASVETKLAHCIQRISQSIGGLRSAAAMQFVVVREPPFGTGPRSADMAGYSPAVFNTFSTSRTSATNQSVLDYFGLNAPVGDTAGSRPHTEERQKFRTPAQIFELFIQNLGPSMRSLAFTLKEILDDFPFDASNHYQVVTNPKFKGSLERALELYKTSRKASLDIVYGQKDMDRSRPIPVQADWEDAAACCGHFSFSLVQVAESVRDYLIILDELQLEVDESPSGRTWTWLKFWKHTDEKKHLDGLDPDFVEVLDRANMLNLQVTAASLRKPSLYARPAWPERSRFKQAMFQRFYDAASFFRRDDIKFAIKVGLGAMLYASISFVPTTRPFYSHWRGEWGLVSYMLVCSMTIGASNTTGYSRILGTCLGAVLAIAAWEIARGDPFAMAFFGFCMAYWTAYIIIGKGKGPMGRFIMLTYNLSALYAYSLSALDDDNDGDEEDSKNNPLIIPIAGHRVAAVISGCIWGLIITRMIWPSSARQKLKDGISLLWLRMGLIWKRDPLSTLTGEIDSHRYMHLREEFYLQQFLSTLQGLADASKSEFDLRRPFPHATYARILKNTDQILGAFHAMNEVILKDPQASPGEELLLRATAQERAQLCGRISHLFNVLASSMKLEYAISGDAHALPNIEHTRDRLLAKVFAYRRSDAQEQRTSDEDYSLLYTYALVTGQLNIGIQKLLSDVEELFGVLDEEALRLE
ncbi:uncharacterized protein A1O9_03550 [Exophiala aquamarina CBS 119918]|uniref:Integral membrane bound transporter domain-containing protein n=1 Tax=Exophiala aquamarina CBS 119918 TaxID=1182545 RepID=A0A072PRL7_9EURO|nr:uncharacterized protein A1O9_03550 [Exophiala aquamarina CBS 119918]KEF61978.1 hypothetical protein A1O9_03550 [Exophiala aquamarina CBS 119918]